MANRFGSKIPFADPAQVGYVGYLERRIESQSLMIRGLRAKQDEMARIIVEMSLFIKGKTIMKNGKLVRFEAVAIEPLGEGPDA